MPKKVVNYLNQTKRCTVCGDKRGPLPLSAFYRCENKLTGGIYYSSMCRSCKRDYNRQTSAYYRRLTPADEEVKRLNAIAAKKRRTREANERLRNAQECITYLYSIGYTAYSIERETGIKHNSIYNYRRGRIKPSLRSVKRLRALYNAKGGMSPQHRRIA